MTACDVCVTFLIRHMNLKIVQKTCRVIISSCSILLLTMSFFKQKRILWEQLERLCLWVITHCVTNRSISFLLNAFNSAGKVFCWLVLIIFTVSKCCDVSTLAFTSTLICWRNRAINSKKKLKNWLRKRVREQMESWMLAERMPVGRSGEKRWRGEEGFWQRSLTCYCK